MFTAELFFPDQAIWRLNGQGQGCATLVSSVSRGSADLTMCNRSRRMQESVSNFSTQDRQCVHVRVGRMEYGIGDCRRRADITQLAASLISRA